MRIVLQRVSEARVRVGGETVGEIGAGLLLLCAFRATDDLAVTRWMAAKCAGNIHSRDSGLIMFSKRTGAVTGSSIASVASIHANGSVRITAGI